MCKRRCFSCLATAHAISTATAQRALGSEHPCRTHTPGVTSQSHPPLVQPQHPCAGHPAPEGPALVPVAGGENWGPRGTPGVGMKFAPTLRRTVPPKQRMEAHGHASGIAQRWTMHLLLQNTMARQCRTPWLNKHSSQLLGTDPKTAGGRAHHPHSKPLGNFGHLRNPGWMTAAIRLCRDRMSLIHGETSPRLPTAPAELGNTLGRDGRRFIRLVGHVLDGPWHLHHSSVQPPKDASTGQAEGGQALPPSCWLESRSRERIAGNDGDGNPGKSTPHLGGRDNGRTRCLGKSGGGSKF